MASALSLRADYSAAERPVPMGWRWSSVEPLEKDLPLIEFAGRHLDIEHHIANIVDHRVLLVGRLQPTIGRAGLSFLPGSAPGEAAFHKPA